MSTTHIKFSGFEEISSFLDTEKKRLTQKCEDVRLLSYIFRRVPLYSGLVLCFFIIIILLSLVKIIELKTINLLLQELSVTVNKLGYLEWIGIFFSLAIINLFLRKEKSSWRKKIGIALVSFIIQLSVLTLSLLVFNTSHPVILGVTIFGTISIISTLVNYTLGYTRRYMRYQFFSERAEQLSVQFRSLECIGVPFTEQHIRELVAFYAELVNSKYDATLGDSFYLLKQLEKRISVLQGN